MIGENEFDRLLTHWLEADGPQDVPTRLVDGALSTARREGQAGGWLDGLLGRRWPADPTGVWSPAGRRVLALALTGLVVAGLIGGAFYAGRSLLTALPTPSPSPSPAPTATAAESSAAPTAIPAPTPTREPHGLIVYSADQKLYTLDPDSGAPALLAEFGSLPTWSPDGTRVAFHGSGWQTIGLDRKAPSDGRSGEFLAWSPDGTRFSMLHNPRGYRVTDWQSGEAVDLPIDGSSYAAAASWSPDGKALVIAIDTLQDVDAVHDLLVVSPDGANERRLTTTIRSGRFDHDEMRAEWSPDGRWIAYVDGSCKADDCRYDLRVVAAEGGDPASLASVRDGRFAPRWSPDSSSLLYADGSGVIVVPRDGGKVRLITDRPIGLVSSPGCGCFQSFVARWSPDGRRIAFVTDEGLWVVDADGKHERLVVRGEIEGFDW